MVFIFLLTEDIECVMWVFEFTKVRFATLLEGYLFLFRLK